MTDEKKTKNEKLKEKLFIDKKNSWELYGKSMSDKIYNFSEGYMKFLSECKTERLVNKFLVQKLEKNGFVEISKVKKLSVGDKVYKNVKSKAVLASIIGNNNDSFRIIGSHCDSPRLDLKPNPLYEDSGICMMQSHYYGGIKKYHWVNTPLELHGIIFTKDNKKIEISIGNKDDEPKFIIPDLLPHLAKNQMDRESRKLVSGEELNIVVGHLPVVDEKIKEKVKFTILKKLNDEYGIIEEDFTCAELEFVPAIKPTDIGFDRAIIGSYGQDDKVCAYTSLLALLDSKKINHTVISLFADKEEIGSMGNTGAESFMLKSFSDEILLKLGSTNSSLSVFENSMALSADVTAGVNPNYKDVHDLQNASSLGFGVAIEKYGGGGGKYSTNDANSEYMAYIRSLADKNKICWQTGELGKIDLGGGGTIAMFMSRYGIDTVDVGPAVLGMHSPCELSSKVDVYSAYLLYKAFFED